MIVFARPVPTRGADASSRTSGAGCDGRVGVARRAAWMRTAKPRGPGPPTLGPSLKTMIFRRRRLSSPVLRGDRGISRNTIARGMPVDAAEPVVTAACVSCCRRAMGEAITRHSPRPLISEALVFKTRTDRVAGTPMLVVARERKRRSHPCFSKPRDGLLRPVRNDLLLPYTPSAVSASATSREDLT
jgi:hypothetical protein